VGESISNMKPLVSILIPAFNADRWLSETLRSALAQQWPRIEIIVVDDGSSDQTLAVARAFASKRVNVVSQPNAGAAAARNTALSLSQGDWIQWLDADDLLAPDKIQKQMEAFESEPNRRLLLSSEWGAFMSRPARARFKPTALWQDLLPVEWLLLQLERNLYMQTATWLVSRELTAAAGPWETRLAGAACDDGEYFSRVILASEGVRFVPRSRVFYRMVGRDRLSYVGRSQKKMKALLLGLQLYFENLRSKDDSARVRTACVKYLQTMLNDLCPESDAMLDRARRIAAACGGDLNDPELPRKYALVQRVLGRTLARRVQLGYNDLKSSLFRSWDEALFHMERH
jgi:glycosyltransferase involved in cell wall biosynthesis